MKRLLTALAAMILAGCATTTSLRAVTATLRIDDGGKDIGVPVRLVEAARRPAPTILLSPNCGGPGTHSAEAAEVVRNWGYNVVVVDSHSGRGFRSTCSNTLQISEVQRTRDLIAAAEWAAQQPWHTGKIGAIGYSAGGHAVTYFAEETNHGRIAAVVGYYPWCNPFGADPKIPVQIHIGTKDDWTPHKRCQWPHYESKREVHYYEGAAHSFDDERGPRTVLGHFLASDPVATKAAAEKSRAFFDRHLH